MIAGNVAKKGNMMKYINILKGIPLRKLIIGSLGKKLMRMKCR
jgi:hypothetical protein